MAKNPGKILLSTYRGLVDAIPLKYRAKLGLTQTSQEVPLNITEDVLTHGIVASSVEQVTIEERKKTNVSLTDPTGKLPSQVMLPNQLVGSVTEQLVPEDTGLKEIDELTEEATQTNIGVGLVDQRIVKVTEIFQDIEPSREIPDWIPERFKLAVPGIQKIENVVKGDAKNPPPLTAGQLKVTEKQLTKYKKLVTQLLRTGYTLPIVLTSTRTDENKQLVTVTEIIQNAGTERPKANATQNIVVQALGEGHEVVIKENVDGVFPKPKFSLEAQDWVPTEFQDQVPKQQTSVIKEGNAGLPVLGSTDLYASEEQLTLYTTLLVSLKRAGVALPVSIVGADTNEKKQDVTITRTLRLKSNSHSGDPSPTPTRDVVIQALDSKHVVETTRTVNNVFDGVVGSVSIADAFPPVFKAFINRRKHTLTGRNAAEFPSIDSNSGEISATERQLQEGIFERETETISLVTGTNYQDVEIIEKFGGGVAVTVRFLYKLSDNQTLQTPGLIELEGKITQLGQGWVVKERKYLAISTVNLSAASSFPLLHGTKIDKQYEIALPYTEQYVAEGTGGSADPLTTVQIEVEPHDWQRALRRVISSSSDLGQNGKFLDLVGITNIEVPPQLSKLTGIKVSGGGGGASFTTVDQWQIAAPGTGSIYVKGGARSASSIIYDLSWEVKQIWGRNVPCRTFVFTAPYGSLRGTLRDWVRAKFPTEFPVAILDWPKFTPKVLTFICTGGKAVVTEDMDIRQEEDYGVDSSGNQHGQGIVSNHTISRSIDSDLISKPIVLPPMINPQLIGRTYVPGRGFTDPTGQLFGFFGYSMNGITIDVSEVVTNQASGGITAAGSPLNVVGTQAQVFGGITSTALSYSSSGGGILTLAPSDTVSPSIPASGKYVHRLVTEPYGYGHFMVRLDIIDFADIQ